MMPQPPSRQRPRKRRPSGNQRLLKRPSTTLAVEGAMGYEGAAMARLSRPVDFEILDTMRGGGTVLRGEVEEQLAARQALDHAIAQRRRETAKAAGEAQRVAAQRRQSSKRREGPPRAASDEGPLPPVEEKPTADDFHRQIFDAMVERSNRRASKGSEEKGLEEPSGCISPQSNNGPRGSILHCLAPKTPHVERMKSLDSFCKQGRKMNRMQRLLEKKREEFDQKPDAERTQLTEAFQRHDKDNSGSLDSKEMLECLVDLGLKPHTGVEWREIRIIAQEVAVLGTVDFLQFCFEMVPRTRAKLRELRHGPLLREFKLFDEDDSGYLDREECMQVLETICMANLDPQGLQEMEQVFAEIFGELSDERNQLDFEGFQELVGRAREHHQRIVGARISEIHKRRSLNAEDVRQHADELVLIHASFQRMESESGRTGWDGTRAILVEYGVLPHDDEDQAAVMEKFTEAALVGNGEISFRDCLRLIRCLRAAMLIKDEHTLREMFDRLDRDRSCSLEISEVSTLLEELGVQPQCWEDQMQLRRLLDVVDEDESGTLSFDEFALLVQRVREQLATAARRRQRAAAATLGFDEHEVAELRDVFFELDAEQDGYLQTHQLRQALDMMRKSMSAEDLRALVADVDVAGTGLVDFHSFLKFFRAVSPPAPDGHAAGYVDV